MDNWQSLDSIKCALACSKSYTLRVFVTTTSDNSDSVEMLYSSHRQYWSVWIIFSIENAKETQSGQFAEKEKAYKFVIHALCMTELCDLWCMTSQLRGARFSGKWSYGIWIPATAGVSSAHLAFSVSHIHCYSIFLWHNGKGELLDLISENMICTDVAKEWIFLHKPCSY